MSQCAFAGKTAEVIHGICWQTSAKRKLCNLCGVALILHFHLEEDICSLMEILAVGNRNDGQSFP